MSQLAAILHIFIGATLGGVFLVASLLLGYTSLWVLLGAMGLGGLVGGPIARQIARVLVHSGPKP